MYRIIRFIAASPLAMPVQVTTIFSWGILSSKSYFLILFLSIGIIPSSSVFTIFIPGKDLKVWSFRLCRNFLYNSQIKFLLLRKQTIMEHLVVTLLVHLRRISGYNRNRVLCLVCLENFKVMY